MPITTIDFFNLADKLLPKSFNGDSTSLVTFIDALNLLKINCTGNEQNALSFVKTRLTGKARLAVTSDIQDLDGVIAALRIKCAGEKSHVVEAKLASIKQNGKNAAIFVKEIEDLTASLYLAYTSEGIPAETAEKFVRARAVRSLATNARSDKTKLVMEAGTFNTLQDAISKFLTVEFEPSEY